MRDNNFDEKKDKKREKLVVILLLLLVILISLSASVWSIFFDKSHATITPEYALVPEDKGAKKISGEEGKSEEKLSHPDGGGSVGISCSPKVKIDRSENKATLMFQNPSRSNNDMVVRLVVQDTLLAESGKLVPGKEIDSMEILEESVHKLQLGTYEGTFIISLYDHDTGEKAMMESSVNVQVEVRD